MVKYLPVINKEKIKNFEFLIFFKNLKKKNYISLQKFKDGTFLKTA